MTIKEILKVGDCRPSFIGWTILQILFAETFVIELRFKFGNTSKLEALIEEIPEGEGEDHAAGRSFEDWRKEIKNQFKV